MTPEQTQLSSAGILSPWLLYGAQHDVYIHQHKHRFPFCEMNRRFGKTFTTYLRLHEILSRNKNAVARWCEPWKNQCREILQPEIQKIAAMIPGPQRPVWRQTDSFYEFPHTDARLYLRGVNEDKGESARGAFSDIIVCDEMGSYKDAKYVINEVLLPQLMTTRGQMIIIGTPPRKLDHEYYRYKAQAIQNGSFMQKTIKDCVWFSEEEIAEMCKAVGGEKSAAWEREFLCQPRADEESLVLPEFSDVDHVVDNPELPPFYDIYVAMDAGFHDHTAVLIAVFDFLKRRIIITDEIWVRGKNSEDIASMVRTKLRDRYGALVPYRYVADAPAQVLYDLSSLHKLPFVAPLKDDKFAAINNVRLLLSERRIVVARRCENLAFQAKVGMWNEKKKDFERSSTLGHLDAIAALVYLCRTVDWERNPYPALAPDANYADYWINEQPRKDAGLAGALFPFTKKNGPLGGR